MNISSTREPTKSQLSRTKQNQTQTSFGTGSNEPGGVAPVPAGYHDIMGVIAKVLGRAEMARNGSILKLMLKQGGCSEIEAAIRGLPLVIPGCTSLRPLWTAKQRDGRLIAEDIYAQAVQAHYQSQKETQPKPKRSVWTPEVTDEGPQPLDFSRFAA